MAEVKKWSVTYTKHVKQKRKIYQDGFLELHSSKNKVILYDECENILESRFVKKDDTIELGETLAFDSHLVDIGDPEGDHKPTQKFNPKDTKINRTYESFQSPKFETKPNLGAKKAKPINLSPSQKVIREFKKSEMTKYGSSPDCPETIKTSKTEWQVLYTIQVTQKAKKYHDGFLQLLTCGSQGKQVVLYDETRRLLESKFLKKDEIIRSGESIALDGHLVDIGECEEDHKPPMNFKVQGRNCSTVGKKAAAYGQMHSLNQLPTGEYQKEAVPRGQMDSNFKSSILEDNISTLEGGKNPIRAAHEILSILRKTKTEMDVATMKRSSAEVFHASRSSSSFQSDSGYQTKEQLQDVCNEASTIVHPDKENRTTHKDNSEIPKDEAINEVLSVEISKSANKGTKTASSFFVGSGATNNSIRMVDIDYIESSRMHPDAPVLGTKGLATLEVDSKTSIASVLKDPSTGDLKSGNCSEQVYCKDNPTEATASGSDTSQLSVEIEHEKPCAYREGTGTRWQTGVHVTGMATSSDGTPHDVTDYQNISEQDTSRKKTDEFPCFDLGF
ncbi:hypothetical protein ACH5RR_041744 [Cinchona calisaya]|uniref:5'-3' DNA helicase ZGRF1-like N-terminal domain-containing protein n=1 Tax=Cinchona calisaya TaxID=153742 RepID=A0ABD2XXL6_9GENT